MKATPLKIKDPMTQSENVLLVGFKHFFDEVDSNLNEEGLPFSEHFAEFLIYMMQTFHLQAVRNNYKIHKTSYTSILKQFKTKVANHAREKNITYADLFPELHATFEDLYLSLLGK
jgi:hypothetical protein